jgi:predicted HTH transcriptional regulator
MRRKLTDLLSNGEGQTIEFKKSLALRREGLETLCAMVNTDVACGTVIFGIDNSGTVVGVEDGNLDKAQRTLSQAINSGFDPPLISDIWVETSKGKSVIMVHAQRMPTVPYHEYTGRAWIRQGSEKRQLTLDEKDHLRRSRDLSQHYGPWKCDHCGSIVGQLFHMTFSGNRVEKTYNCECGGQFWPAT